MLSVSLLGRFNIRCDDAPVTDIESPRLQSLLAYLVLNRDSPQSRAHLAFLFWPDTTEDQARANLRNLLHTLRHTLPNADDYLAASVQTIQWRSESEFSLDVVDFEKAVNEAESIGEKGENVSKNKVLEKAIALYTGDLLPSCYDDWIITLREGLRQTYLSVVDRLVTTLEHQREYQAAIRYAQLLLQYDSLQEATYRNLIRLHALNNDRASALRVFHTCTTILQRELDVEPSAATQEVYEQLLGTETITPELATTAAFSPLVGRDGEWTQMLEAWKEVVADGEPHTFMLSGVAGIGKTRLVEEIVQWAGRQGIVKSSARCYAAEGSLAYAPVTTWLRSHSLPPLEDVWLEEVTRLLPEVLAQRPDLPQPGALTEAWQRQHLFEGLSRAILGIGQPLLLTIDDLQWCDQDTLEWIHFLLRFNPHAQLLVIGTYRPEEIADDHPLRSLLHALRLEGHLTEVDLQPLDEKSTQTLANLVAGLEIESKAAQRLYLETEGNPLFVVETIRAGLQINDQAADNRMERNIPGDTFRGGMSLPTKVQSVLIARLSQLTVPTRQLAELAATIGREFSFKLLAKTSGSDEDNLVRELDELWKRRIIREHGLDGYDFSHDKLREVAYISMSSARRKLLHHHIAQALEVLHAADLDPISRQLAAHYEDAGLLEQAIPYYLRAARVVRRVYANDEAIALLQSGLDLLQICESSFSESKVNQELGAELWEEMGDILEMRAQHEEALHAYQSAQAIVSPGKRLWKARLYRKAGAPLREQRFYVQALMVYNQAEVALGEPPDTAVIDWWREWIEVQVDRTWAHYWLAQWPEMEALVNKVKPVVQEIGGSAIRSRYLMASLMPLLRKERYAVSDEMLAISHAALAASQEWGDMKARVECQFEVGFLHLWRYELKEAEENLLIALDMLEISGMVPFKTLSLTYLTVVNRFKGMVNQVLAYTSRAQEIAESAHMPDYVAAARGNQAWLAWRNADLVTAEQRGQEALKIWRQSPLVYPFQWQALWPLIGIAVVQGRNEETWAYVDMMLDPLQQLLPEKLNTTLEAAAQARTKGDAEAASNHLGDAIDLAHEMGYL